MASSWETLSDCPPEPTSAPVGTPAPSMVAPSTVSVMVWVPTVRLEIVKVAVVMPLVVVSVPWPMLVEPSKKVTVPLGLPGAVVPGALTLTVAVKVTSCPEDDGLAEELTTVVVLALLTVCPPESVPLLPIKLLSPT